MVAMPVLRPRAAVRFAHPAESQVAHLLDVFGVRWLYEPTTFPLLMTGDGRPIQCFTPDFFLPDHNVYVEMTTMRQSLVTRKNRKFRLMRELFPHLDVKLLYRKDVELITGRYGTTAPVTEGEIGPVIATPDQIRRKAQEIAAYLSRFGDEPLALIGLGRGAEQFRDLIAQEMQPADRTVHTATIVVTPSTGGATAGELSVELVTATDLSRSRRVIVADIVATGLSCWAARAWLDASALPVDNVVTLLERRSARLLEVPITVPGLPAPSCWIVGAGMGRAEFARSLPASHGVNSAR
jgi:hypoxanthine phosphoribosyltransferase